MYKRDTIFQLNKEQEYTRSQIYEALAKDNPALSYNSFKWIISDMLKDGVIFRMQRGKYVVKNDTQAGKSVYEPTVSEHLLKISKKIAAEFPLVNFVCFESVQLNEFLNHLIGNNTFFIFVEKDAIDFVFRFLQEETEEHILLKPNEKEWDTYCTGNNIVMLNLISEAPRCVGEYHCISIEQLLVDIVAEKTFRHLYSRNELQRIYILAGRSYMIDYAKLLRYARRRSKEDDVKELIGGIKGAYAG